MTKVAGHTDFVFTQGVFNTKYFKWFSVWRPQILDIEQGGIEEAEL